MSRRYASLGLIALLGSVACSGDDPSGGGDGGTKLDGAFDPTDASGGGAGRCIKGSDQSASGGTFLWGDIVVCESQGTIQIQLPRPPEYPSGEVQLRHEISSESEATNDTDFTKGGGRLTWPSGDTLDKPFELTILDDDEVEGDEILELSLSRYAGDGYWNSYGEHMRILIVDDDVDNSSQPFLVANINPGRTEGAQIGERVAFGGALYFAAEDGFTGLELWKSDGTASGTAFVKDIFPGREGSGPANFAAAGDRLYFTAIEERYGARVLFRTDGTTRGTVRPLAAGAPIQTEELVAYSSGVYFVVDNALWRAPNLGEPAVVFEFASSPKSLVVSGDVVFFSADDGTAGAELWRSDGTPSGTSLVADIIPGTESSSPQNLIVLNGKILFDGIEGPGLSTRQYYVSDGTPGDTQGLGTFNYGSSLTLTNAVVAEDRVFFTYFPVSYRGALFVSDGTAPGTQRLGEFSGVGRLTAIGRDIYFAANDDVVGYEPWVSNGTPEGTVILADLNTTDSQSTPAISSDPRDFFTVNSKIYFTASPDASGPKFWRTDGTSAGTVMVDLGAAVVPSEPTLLGPRVFFPASDDTTGRELWMMDTARERAERVKDINLIERGSEMSDLTRFGDQLLFSANDEVRGRELWQSDGTTAGTKRLYDLRPDGTWSNPHELTVAGGRLFFLASGPEGRQGLWSTNALETMPTETPLPGNATLPRIGPLTAFGDTVLFNMNDENEVRALWRSDGTAEGTVQIAPEASQVAVAGTTIFLTIDGAEGRELWKSDGTLAGLQLIKDVQAGPYGSYPERFTVVGDLLYFVANDGTVDEGLWRSDGTEAGTVFVAEVDRDSRLVPTSNALFFSTGSRLYRSTRTSASPELIRMGIQDFAAKDGRLYFTIETEDYDRELWTSDGTAAGSRAVRTYASNWLRDGLEQHAFVGNVFVFSTSDGFLGDELWRSDGTREGTFRVTDSNPGTGDFEPNGFVSLGDALFFRATTPETGEELWGYRP